LLGYAESCKRKVTISAREMATNHQIKEESPYKPETVSNEGATPNNMGASKCQSWALHCAYNYI